MNQPSFGDAPARPVGFTLAEDAVLWQACNALDLESPADVLDAATDGDEDTLRYLRRHWPKRTPVEKAWLEIAELNGRWRTANRGRLDHDEAIRIQRRIQVLKTRHPRRPTRRRDVSRKMYVEVIEFLLGLAAEAPRLGAGRPSVADGIRVLLEGVEDA